MEKIEKEKLDWLTLERIDEIESEIFFYEEDNKTLGFYSYDISNKILSILIYVYEKYRNQSIGSKIYQKLIEKTNFLEYKSIEIEFLDNGNAITFFKKRGFKVNYISTKMTYQNASLENVNASIIEKYNDCYFDEVNRVSSDAFYEVLKANDLKPYRSIWSDEYRKWLNSGAVECYIIRQNNEIVGFSCIKENEIDKVFVNPKYQNKGYGKILTTHAINTIINNGYSDIKLFCLINNPNAKKLYQSLGFISQGDVIVMKKDL